MGRRADHTREELHELALTAARTIVSADGLRGLTARGVARGIGYTIGTIYNLFDDLDDLIVHLNGTTLDALYEAVTAEPVGHGPEAALRAYARRYKEFTDTHPKLWRALFEHQLPDGYVRPRWYEPKVIRLLGLAERALEPFFEPDQTTLRQHHARVLWSSLYGICSLAQSQKINEGETATALTDTLITTYLAGLSAHNGD